MHSIGIEQGSPALNGLQPLSRHFEEPNLHCGAESVFDPSYHAVRMVPVSFKGQHNINNVLQHSGARQLTVLGDMPHCHDGGPVALAK